VTRAVCIHVSMEIMRVCVCVCRWLPSILSLCRDCYFALCVLVCACVWVCLRVRVCVSVCVSRYSLVVVKASSTVPSAPIVDLVTRHVTPASAPAEAAGEVSFRLPIAESGE
jgi:hypothetical protein